MKIKMTAIPEINWLSDREVQAHLSAGFMEADVYYTGRILYHPSHWELITTSGVQVGRDIYNLEYVSFRAVSPSAKRVARKQFDESSDP